jgi:hypothetical protein
MLKQTHIRKMVLAAVLSAGFAAVVTAQPAIGTAVPNAARATLIAELRHRGIHFLVYGTLDLLPVGALVTFAPFPLPKWFLRSPVRRST